MDHRMTMSAKGLEDEQNHYPWLSVSFPMYCGPVTVTETKIFIKTLSIQQVQQEGPLTLGALLLSIIPSTPLPWG